MQHQRDQQSRNQRYAGLVAKWEVFVLHEAPADDVQDQEGECYKGI
jgi:hypothetical protein